MVWTILAGPCSLRKKFKIMNNRLGSKSPGYFLMWKETFFNPPQTVAVNTKELSRDTPYTSYFSSTLYTPLTYFPKHLLEIPRQEQELAGDIGKHSQSQRNYEQNLAEMTSELWRVSECDELVGVTNRR